MADQAGGGGGPLFMSEYRHYAKFTTLSFTYHSVLAKTWV